MTTQRLFSSLLSVSALFLISGCISATPPISSRISVAEAARNTLAATLTNTLAPAISPTKTPTGTPTITLTSVPTLPADEAYARLREYLTNSSDCRLPCWWGITPGQSTMLDVQALLAAFSEVAEYIDLGESRGRLFGSLWILYPNDEHITFPIESFYLARANNNGVVSVVMISTRAYRETNGALEGPSLEMLYGHPLYNKVLEDFTLTGILSRYGPPGQIFVTADVKYVGLDNNPLPTDTFTIRLLYPDRGIFVRYEMPVERAGDKFRFCPSKAFINLDLISPRADENYQDVLLAIGWEGFFPPSEYNKTPEEALGMTIEEFYRQFRLPTDRCLETPISIWPGR